MKKTKLSLVYGKATKLFEAIATGVKICFHSDPRLYLSSLGLVSVRSILPSIVIILNSLALASISGANLEILNAGNVIRPVYLVGIAILAAAFTAIIGAIDQYFRGQLSLRCGQFVEETLAKSVDQIDYIKLQDREFSNRLAVLRTEASYRPLEISDMISQIAGDILTAASACMLIWLWIPKLLVLSIVLFVPYFLFRYRTNLREHRTVGRRSQIQREAAYQLALSGSESSFADRRQSKLMELLFMNYRALREQFLSISKKNSKRRLGDDMIGHMIVGFGTLFVALYGLSDLFLGAISFQRYLMYSQAAALLMGTFRNVIVRSCTVVESAYFLRSFNEITRMGNRGGRESIIDGNQRIGSVQCGGLCSARNLSFQYSKDSEWIISRQSVHLSFGQVVAVIGPNGSGKSTFLRLLGGVLEPTEGTVTVAGYRASAALSQGHICFLGQGSDVYQMSIRDNVELGRRCSDDVLNSALERSSMQKFLDKHGWTTKLPLGKALLGGIELSGGQRQVLALARVLLESPVVLVLDEPTSMVDQETECFIMEKLESYARGEGRLVVISTHNPRIVERADSIVDLSNGLLDLKSRSNPASTSDS